MKKIWIFVLILVIADFFLILWAQRHFGPPPDMPEIPTKEEIKEMIPVSTPNAFDFRALKTGGEVKKKLQGMQDKLTFRLKRDLYIESFNGMKALNVCFPGGLVKTFYTSEMPWAFLLYEFEEKVPTIALFEIDKDNKEGKFEIVILDKNAGETVIKSVEVTIFVETLKQYMPGYEWRGSVRKEIN